MTSHHQSAKCPTFAVRATLLVALLVVGIGACSPRVEVRGNQPDPDRLAEIKPGEVTKDEIIEILGSPSNIAAFGGETWYYINETTETFAFFRPEVVERQIIAMSFDNQDLLEKMALIDETSGREIEMVDRTTPTTGHEITFFEQILGNFGRIGN